MPTSFIFFPRSSLHRRAGLFAGVVITASAALPVAAQVVPMTHVPPAILVEVSAVERAFDAALVADCSSDRCSSKGCVYVQHQTVDLPRTASLPGISADEGPGSVAPQEYLTEARCEFTHEKSVSTKDVQALARRLEQRLSRGWRKVVVAPQLLEPVSKALSEPEAPKEPPKDEEKPPPAPPAPTEPPAPPEWNSETAWHELWDALLPHSPWMVAIFLLTIATAVLIWAGRRLGAKTMEEKMMEAQLSTPTAPGPASAGAEASGEARSDAKKAELEEEKSFAEQQEKLWMDRISHVESKDDEMVVELLREWLRAGDFPMLARALFIFGDRLSTAFTSDGALAIKKLEFADYFRDLDEATLPSRAEFFRRLNQHAMSSLLMSQDDVQLYRSLREDFGSSGVVGLMQQLPHRYAALLFALVPRDSQYDVAGLLAPELRVAVADQLLASSRISKEESAYVFSCISAARDVRPLPDPPKAQITDRGPSLDAAAALSVLLPQISAADRSALFARALQNGRGATPRWFEDIFFSQMLDRIAPEQRNDLLLDVDVRGLAAWLSLQEAEWQRGFVGQLSQSMQNALRSNASFSSRTEQMQLARRGHQDLIRALKVQYAKGRSNFVTLAA